MKFRLLLLLTILAVVPLTAQNINGRLTASFYAFERFDSTDASKMNVRNYETFNLNINEGKFSLRTRMNYETNISNPLDSDPRFRLYNLYVEARDLFDLVTVKLGRQPFFYSVGGGVYDAANVTVKSEHSSATLFYGGNVPAYQKAELAENWGDNYIIGARVITRPSENLSLMATYVDKNVKALDYETVRLDENNNVIDRLIQNKSNQYRFLSGEVRYELPKVVDAVTSVDFDVNYKKLSRIEVSGRYLDLGNWGLQAYYQYRAPRIRYNSIFAVFDFANTHEIELGVDYKFTPSYVFFAKLANVTYKDDDAQRITFGLNTKYGSVSYRKNLGYAGEMDALTMYGAAPLFCGLVTPSIGVSVTTYKLSKDAERNNLISFIAGVNIHPLETFSVDVQAQYVENKIYKNDFRFFIKLNHWFNTNVALF